MPQCICRAVGSYRYRVTCRTQGGHSYGAFGAPNAIELLCRLVEKLYAIEPPKGEKTRKHDWSKAIAKANKQRKRDIGDDSR